MPATAQTEIDYLLARVAVSQCQFNRNGTWYDARQAEAHLRDKYNYLAKRNSIASAEDFIEKAGSRSSLSGRSYGMQCGGADEIEAGRWLRERLAEYRSMRH